MDHVFTADQFWVKSKIQELFANVVQGFEWGGPEERTAEGFFEGSTEIIMYVGERLRRVRFTESELEEVVESPEVRAVLLRRLRAAVK